MASVSESQSTGHSQSQSTSDTYIPEYSESPFLRATAELARQRSNEVYEWGRSVYDRNQGSIDALMRDALSYASPQRIAADMGMAMAGVQQAGERGRLSAIRDLESYGIDPSSGRYAALDSANRVMTAAAAAGAGNQQRMASQAAGNAMRNQAISASLQNANFGSQANRDANAFLGTAMSLKYPPLGRTSQSTSVSDQQSTSKSQTTDPAGGGSKGGGGEKPKQEQQPKQPQQPQQRPQQQAKPQPEKDQPPQRAPKDVPPKGKLPPLDVKTPEGAPSFDEKGFEEAFPPQDELTPPDEKGLQPPDPFDDPNAPLTPPDETGLQPPTDELTPPDETGLQPPTDELTPPDETGLQPDPYSGLTGPDEVGLQPPEDPWGGLTPPAEEGLQPGDAPYDPYAGQTMAEQQAFDPITGEPVGSYGDERVAEDPAGSLYGIGEAGTWTGDVAPASYIGEEPAADTWSDIGQGTMEQPAGPYDSTYDDPYASVDWGAEIYDRDSDLGVADETDPIWGGGGLNYGDFGDDPYNYGDFGDDAYGDYGDDLTDYGNADDPGNVDDYYDDYDWSNYEDDYSDWSEEDYYDDQAYDDSYDYEDDPYGDYSDEDYYEDYADEDYYDDYNDDYYDDYDDDYSDYEDYEDYTDDTEDYEDYDYPESEDYTDYEDSGGGEEGGDDYYEDSGGGEEGGDEGYARGGPVKRRAKMPIRARGPGGPRPRPRPGMRPRRPRPMPTGYRPRPPMRRPPPRPPMSNGQLPAFARGGTMPPPGRQLDRPPTAPGRMARPQQAPRPARGAPMMAPGGPQPTPMIGRGPQMPGNFISPNGLPPPTSGGMQRPQRMAGGGQAGRQPEPTQGGFVSRSLSPSGGSTTDDVNARLNAGEFVIPKDVATWKGKEFFYKMIASARKNRSAPNGGQDKPQTGYNGGGMR